MLVTMRRFVILGENIRRKRNKTSARLGSGVCLLIGSRRLGENVIKFRSTRLT